LNYEREVAKRAHASVFVSRAEAELFRRLAPESATRVTHLNNGVDLDYFNPEGAYTNPYKQKGPILVFTGAMDYHANVQAVIWFVREVFPRVRINIPDVSFYIVGARPTGAVRKLAEQPGIQVTGSVRDIRPYIAYASAAVAPLRTARGVQNKVLEAMAMARPVVTTTQAMEGIEESAELSYLVADEPEAQAARIIELIQNSEVAERYGQKGHEVVACHYNWSENLGRIECLLEGSPGDIVQDVHDNIEREWTAQ